MAEETKIIVNPEVFVNAMIDGDSF